MRIPVCIVLLLCVTTCAYCQKDTIQVPPHSKIREAFNQYRDSAAAKWLNQDTLASQARQLSDERFRTTLAMEKQKQKEIEEDGYAVEHRKRSFDFQYNASIGIFVMVILIVVTGLVFSGWQFSLAMKQLKIKEALVKTPVAASTAVTTETPTIQAAAPVEENNAAISTLKSDVELSTTGIKANSSVLGVIILVLSIAFFYLYLIYVYPIKYLSPASTGNKPDTTITEKDK